ncbi:MAG: class I SAM-dependent DNA methyltransferase [Paracoccaceae bacterium]
MNQKSKAYKLSSPKDNKEFYNILASRYDTDFYDDIDRENRGYPKKVADIYFQMAKNDNTPIADIGCGTGALGKHFMTTNFIIDGFDISSGMLSEAKKKGYYRNLYECDLTKTEQLPKQKYRGLISCSTFTFGHLGPAYLLGIIQMLKKGGLGALGVNKGHYLNNGFENEINKMFVFTA